MSTLEKTIDLLNALPEDQIETIRGKVEVTSDPRIQQAKKQDRGDARSRDGDAKALPKPDKGGDRQKADKELEGGVFQSCYGGGLLIGNDHERIHHGRKQPAENAEEVAVSVKSVSAD